MKRINLALIAGIFLASISLWFSATGLVHLFSGAGTGIILMAIGFEMAKISGVTWLIRNGKKNLLSVGLALATLLLTTVSSLGIYGYLGRAYSSGRSSSVSMSAATGSLGATIGSLESDKDRLYKLIESVPAAQGTNRRRIQAQTQPKIDRIDVKLAVLRDSLAVAQSKQATISNDIGDLRFAADLFGTTQEGLAKLIVTVLAFLLDPLAVMLILASGVKGKRPEVAFQMAVVPDEEPFVPRRSTVTVGPTAFVAQVGDEAVEALSEQRMATETSRFPTTRNESAPPREHNSKLSPALTKVIHRRRSRSP